MTIEQREQSFKEQVFRMISFPKDLLEEFFEYWTEPNKSNTKMRFELEKTWHLHRRLKRWQLMKDQRKDFKPVNQLKTTPAIVKKMEATTEIEKLDAFLRKYQERPTEVPFSDFGQWYDFMKSEKLLRPLTKAEVNNLISIYNGDNSKCRCACVQMTLDGYVMSGFTFDKVYEMRKRLA